MYKDTIFNLENKIALITGGSKGLGKAMAKILAVAGADIIITARNESELKNAQEEISKEAGRKVYAFKFDHKNWKDTPKLMDEIFKKVGSIDILVNNAGTGMVNSIEEISNTKWQELSDLLISAPMAMCKSVIPGMKSKGWGRIINISSILGSVGREKRSAYCCFKGAVQSFSRALALECITNGITINSISPGQFHTPLTEGMWNDPEKYKSVTELIPLKRWGDSSEIGGIILLLASDASSYMTGQNILIDGGWSII